MSEIPLDSTGRIDADVNCVGCQYNLRGLSVVAACPECGTATKLSVSRSMPIFADRKWLRQLRTASTLAMVTFVLLPICLFIAIATTGHTGPRNNLDRIVVLICIGSPMVTGFLGMWKYTVKWPRSGGPARMNRYRIWSRVFVVIDTLLFVIVGPSFCLGLHWIAYNVKMGLMVGLFATTALSAIVLGCYGSQMARQFRDESLSRATKVVSWVCTIVLVFCAVRVLDSVFDFDWPSPFNLLTNDWMWAILIVPVLATKTIHRHDEVIKRILEDAAE